MATDNILFAGYGGQGILFSGKFMTYLGMLTGREVTWLPSYGPEMRGGTANCSVIISDAGVGSPIVSKPDILVCMNLPSYTKYEPAVSAGGFIFADSSLINEKSSRTDVSAFYIPATRLANENNLTGLANMIMLGKILRETKLCGNADVKEMILSVLKKCVSERKKDLFNSNVAAIEIGLGYAD